MLKLGGFAVSNYYNKVKVALLEKGIPFEEVFCMTSQDENYLKRSPMGKVPYLEVDGQFLCESQVICEYLEDHYPDHPLYPKDVFARARARTYHGDGTAHGAGRAPPVYAGLLRRHGLG